MRLLRHRRGNPDQEYVKNEVTLLIEQATGGGARHIAAMFDRWQQRFAGRKFSGSVQLIREDRKR